MRTFFRDMAGPFVRELTGHNRWVHLAFAGIAAVFLCYIYLGKEPFMKGAGYGIPALVSGETAAGERRSELQRHRRLATANPPAATASESRVAELEKRVAEDNRSAPGRARAMHYLKYAGWFFATFVILFVIPVMFIMLHPHLRLRDYGLGLGDWKFSLRIFSVFALIMILAVLAIKIFRIEGFLRYYPMFAEKGVTGSQADFLLWFVIVELCFFLYFVGWEFFFRGLLVFPLSRRIGPLAALVGIVPFAIMHAGKPVAEAFGSIIAAWVLGILVIRARSFWVCPVLHFAIAFVMDLMAALSRNLF